MSPLLVQIGKFGDCINILPFAYMMSKKYGQIDWAVGKKWYPLLEGATYVKAHALECTDDHLPIVLRQNPNRELWITQAWKNPDTSIQTDSFAKEQWRYVGALDERGRWPLIFDNRNPEREQKLVQQWIKKGCKNVLVATSSVSTPYRHARRLFFDLEISLNKIGVNVILLDEIEAERLYDLIALYDAADLLVTIDTCHVHLARASQCPVIFLRNDLAITGPAGWHGATPPPQTIATWGYNQLGDDISPVITAARNHLARHYESIAVVLQTYSKTHCDRHKRSMATHPEGTIYSEHDYPPTTKELLQEGLNQHKDIVVFTHDDVTFLPFTLNKIRAHANKFDFGCSRRPSSPTHIGREIFWFTDDFLRRNWEKLPNPYWSVQKPDLIFARWMRSLRGIPTTTHNLIYDFPPVEVPDVIFHEEHESHWSNSEVENSKEGLHNEALWAAGV